MKCEAINFDERSGSVKYKHFQSMDRQKMKYYRSVVLPSLCHPRDVGLTSPLRELERTQLLAARPVAAWLGLMPFQLQVFI